MGSVQHVHINLAQQEPTGITGRGQRESRPTSRMNAYGEFSSIRVILLQTSDCSQVQELNKGRRAAERRQATMARKRREQPSSVGPGNTPSTTSTQVSTTAQVSTIHDEASITVSPQANTQVSSEPPHQPRDVGLMHPSMLPTTLPQMTAPNISFMPQHFEAFPTFTDWSSLPFNEVSESFTDQLYGTDDLRGNVSFTLNLVL